MSVAREKEGEREGGSELETGKCRKARSRKSESGEWITLQSLCAGCTNLIRTVNRIRGFHAFWIRPATPDSFPFTSPLITPTGHRHLTRYNCSLVPFNVEIEGREERKKRNVRLLSTNCDDELNFNESILFLFVHRISSFFAPFLSYLDHFTIRDIDNIQPIPQRGDRYSYSLHIHPPFSWNNTRGNSIDDAPPSSALKTNRVPRRKQQVSPPSYLSSSCSVVVVVDGIKHTRFLGTIQREDWRKLLILMQMREEMGGKGSRLVSSTKAHLCDEEIGRRGMALI